MYIVKPTTRFRKDLKQADKRGYDLDILTSIIKTLAKGEVLDAKYNDHPLKGEYRNCRECHIAPDWLLIYEKADDTLILYLIRTGTHSDLF